jgi:ABC-type sulfate transport system permease subunit
VIARASFNGTCLTLTIISLAFSTDRDSGSAVIIDPSDIFIFGYKVPGWKSMTSPVVQLKYHFPGLFFTKITCAHTFR